jgi:hypothetical protein
VVGNNKEDSSTSTNLSTDHEAILHLKEAVMSGKNWYVSLLEAISLWDRIEEDHDGRYYKYLIDHEAFDWLTLAARLCEEIETFIPEEERIDLLFFGKPPIELSREEFRHLISDAKYIAYLNYLYGITVEEALVMATEEEMYKEHRTNGFYREDSALQDAYQRVYGSDMNTLLRRFRSTKGYSNRKSINLTEKKEFTYWLFKYRLSQCDKVKVASDTKKALECLNNHWHLRIR